MGQSKEQEVKETSKEKEVFTTSEKATEEAENVCNLKTCEKLKGANANDYLEILLIEFRAKEKPSENILVSIQHLEAVQKLLDKELLEIEVVQ